MNKSLVIVPLVCAVGMFVSGCKDNASKPEGPAASGSMDLAGAAANALETTGKKLKFATVMYDPRTPNLIAPCFYVPKQIREKALNKDIFVMEYSISYLSGGREVTKTATARVSQSQVHVHEEETHDHEEEAPQKKNLVQLKDSIDVTGQIPDPGTKFTGTAALVKDKDGPRVIEGTDTLPGGQ